MEQIISQILTQYGLYGLLIAGFAYFMYRQGQQNLERNKAVERRFDEERVRAAEMENRLLNEFQRAIAEKDQEIKALREQLKQSESRGKEFETAHLNLQREFDQFKGHSEALQQQTIRELDQTKMLYEEERRNGISLTVTNNRLTADNQTLIKSKELLVIQRDALKDRNTELELQVEALRVELDASKQQVSLVNEAKHGADREPVPADSNDGSIPTNNDAVLSQQSNP